MNIWIPSVTTTGLLAFALWLGRNLIKTRLFKSVEHEFNTKIEALRAEFRQKEEILRADLRVKENEITDLRSGALTAMASRQIALDKRMLEAVDQLWAAVKTLSAAKGISTVMSVFKFKAVAEEAAHNEQLRETFKVMGAGFDLKKVDLSGAHKARPFVSPMVWALFSAYQAIIMHSVAKFEIIKAGVGGKNFLKNDNVEKLVKAALPQYAGYIEKYGDAGYHHLLEELEESVLNALRMMLSGKEADRDNIEQAGEILKLSKELKESQEKAKSETESQAATESG